MDVGVFLYCEIGIFQQSPEPLVNSMAFIDLPVSST
jgi:hypothetical protein